MRHKKNMEAIALSKAGKGFRIRPWRYAFRMKLWQRRTVECELKRKKIPTTKNNEKKEIYKRKTYNRLIVT